ncbi:TNF receptor-associated factor family protein DDB_G0277243-like [Stylophora pistillata]|uniref:TNF receptor-associated factor family protein DDB_G0277243-like n=1 Tax=Stylophora pistillata TaxID=50429 RepID=UPI000C04416C|nr:TNF receptor-associated factor family protein DDB_G0277243-like [Stylophora pistillata]
MVTCLWRVVQCVHCQEPHPKGQLKKHVDEICKKVQLPCPLKCGTLVPREKISNHSIIDCPQTIIDCPFAEMGCNTKVIISSDYLSIHTPDASF